MTYFTQRHAEGHTSLIHDRHCLDLEPYLQVLRRRDMSAATLHTYRWIFGTLPPMQQFLGHQSPATTAGYVLIGSEQVRAVVNGLPRH